MKRREVLAYGIKGAALLTATRALGALPESASETWRGVLLSASHRDGKASETLKERGTADGFAICVHDLHRGQSLVLNTPVYIHSFAYNSGQPMIYPLPKFWESALALNMQTGEGKVFGAKPGYLFYGHGVLSPDGKLLYCAEAPTIDGGESRDYKPGIVTVRDSATHELLDEFPTYGFDPHDMALVDDGNTIAIVNGGDNTCVSFVDRKSQKLLEKYEVEGDKLAFRHLAFNASGEFVINPLSRDGTTQPVPFIGRRQQDLQQAESAVDADKLLHQSLSVAVHDQHFCATCPRGHSFSLWSLETGKLLKTVDFPDATGVCLTPDRRYYVVNSFSGNQLALVDTRDLKVDRGNTAVARSERLSGRHLQWKG
jgi:DNA-binding beta-propeller fold protein YncE